MSLPSAVISCISSSNAVAYSFLEEYMYVQSIAELSCWKYPSHTSKCTRLSFIWSCTPPATVTIMRPYL